MARTVAEIEAQIDAQVAIAPALAQIAPNPSAVANWKTFRGVIAICTAVFEQLLDVFTADTEATIAAAPVGSTPWLQSKCFEFQYDAVTPQVLTLVNFAPSYDPIDPTKQIITRAAVVTLANGQVNVKVAKQNPPIALLTAELAAFQSYLTDGGDGTYAGRGRGLGFGGINLKAMSINADQIWIAGTVYYNGLFSSTIQSLVIAAINAYLAALPFNGSVSIIGLSEAIKSVDAVDDLLITDLAIRADATAFANRTFMIQGKTTLITTYPTFSGYCIEETTSGQTFSDTLIFQSA